MNKTLTLLCALMGTLPSVAEAGNAPFQAGADSTHYMKDAPIDLEQVVVTGTRTPKRLKDTPVLTQVITSKDIEERGLTDIKDLLQQEVPGLNFQEVGFGTDIDVQGLGAKHVLFLVDGERIAGENSGNIDYSRLALSGIDRIEIVKGASSALYGSQAMGGVINIITRKARKKVELTVGGKWSERYQRNYHDVNADDVFRVAKENVDKPNLDGNASLGLNLGRFTMNTSLNLRSVDGYQLYDKKGVTKFFPAYGITVEEPVSASPTSLAGYQDLNLRHKMGYRLADWVRLDVHFGYYTMDKYDFTFDNIHDNTEDFSYGASADFTISPTQSLTASFHADHYNRYDKFEKKDGRRLDYRNNILQPKLFYTNTSVEDMAISAGVEYFTESLYTDKYVANVYETKSQWYATAFVQDDWAVNDRLSLIAGLRGDYHKEYGANVTPKLSAMWKAQPFTVRLNYARGFRSPTLKELYMNWDHLGMFQIIGNKDLKPEKNHYVALSGEYASSWVNVSANLYGNWFTNKIEGVWANGETEYHYVNIGRSHLLGFEAAAKVRVDRHFSLNANYNYLYTSKSDGVRLSSSAPHSGTLRAEYNSRVKDWQTVVNLTGRMVGAKEYDVEDEIEVDGKTVSAYYRNHVSAYSIWDLAVTQYVARQWRLTLGVNNLFDYTSDHISFNTSTSCGRNAFIAASFTL